MPLGLFTLYTDRLESSEVDGALIKEFDAGGGPLCLKNIFFRKIALSFKDTVYHSD